MAKILIVDDDPGLLIEIRDWLRFEKYVVDTANCGSAAREKLTDGHYDLVVLDWQLPDISGPELLRELRANLFISPVVMLTGKTTPDDKVTGLDSGADGYLTKPMDPEELSAVIRAILRRAVSSDVEILRFGDLEIRPQSHSALTGEKLLKFSRLEFECLEFLIRHADQRPFSPEALINKVWGSHNAASVESVRTCISQIRQKLESAGSKVAIEFVAGVGYKISPA